VNINAANDEMQVAFHGGSKFAFMMGLAVDLTGSHDDTNVSPGPTIPPADFPSLPHPVLPATTLDTARPFSPFGDFDMEEVAEMNEYSNDELEGIFTQELFTNGLDFDLEAAAGTFRLHVETANRHQACIERKEWSPSTNLSTLPFIWQMRKNTHHYADLWMSVAIVAHELGFESPINHVECRGWTLNKIGGRFKLQYRRLDEMFFRKAP